MENTAKKDMGQKESSRGGERRSEKKSLPFWQGFSDNTKPAGNATERIALSLTHLEWAGRAKEVSAIEIAPYPQLS